MAVARGVHVTQMHNSGKWWREYELLAITVGTENAKGVVMREREVYCSGATNGNVPN